MEPWLNPNPNSKMMKLTSFMQTVAQNHPDDAMFIIQTVSGTMLAISLH